MKLTYFSLTAWSISIACALGLVVGCVHLTPSPVKAKRFLVFTGLNREVYFDPSSMPALVGYLDKIHWKHKKRPDTGGHDNIIPAYFLTCYGIRESDGKEVVCGWSLDENCYPYNDDYDNSPEFEAMSDEVHRVFKPRVQRLRR